MYKRQDKAVFELLNLIAVYPVEDEHKLCDKDGNVLPDVFLLPAGSTVIDLAHTIHRQMAENLKSARCWGTGVHDGQNVHRTHVLCDKDIIELHFS